ncbi:hypothetical protein BOTBODRAFT_176029 [Botryobasidium botryosum FD-172 SS1]|uniref:Uncharacterized protein n=1 Tax=Botryobasidium botryosum (strain FD-172 SS1) TaxID=930990 RepID=A0A067MMU9_BOTB1|nr:hypothetical protein BOTBODRAFT_176029 [Botryobasidium botryosum FD-172 SS1]
MLTPLLPDQWDILAKHGPAVLEHHMGKKFSVLTHGPTKDVVLHGWGATHDALPNVGNVCAKVTTALGLDPYDIVVDKSRWLVGKNTNPNRPPLLLLAISTNEAVEKLLYQNPHWIEGKKIAFKVFSSDPTIPNQCARCWKVGHPTWRCGVKTPVCGLCSDGHATTSHRCHQPLCNIVGDKCPHFTMQCPNCQDAHEAWDRKCVERQIQKAANPPKKRAQTPAPQTAAVDSPLRKAADLIRSIPKDRLGHPSRDISKYKDLELVKKFRLWALFNELPLIVTSPTGDVSCGQPAGQKKKPTPPKESPPKETSVTTITPEATVTTQIQPAASYAAAASKGARTPKFNPSPKIPSAYRKKVRDPLTHGEVLFAPESPFGRDDNNGTIDGQNGLNLINGSLKDLTPTCSVKGLRWTSRGNLMLTPQLPDQWDILAKHGPAVLEHHMGKKFSVLTHGPTKDVVLHGWGASHDALPNIGNVCAKVTTALGLDPYDIVVDKSRWLVGKNTNPNRPPLLLLAISTDEAAEKLLYQNPHWIEGKKIAFKVFSSDPTIPNQCARCWKVGHPTWRCGVKTPVCGLCSDGHATTSHRCHQPLCNIVGDKCPHFTMQCPNCQDAHKAWDRKCVERQIQKAANPPKKRAQTPAPQTAAVDSPLRKAADLIRSIPKDRLGYPSRDILRYKDLELVKKFRLWALFNELPLIVTSPTGEVSWSPPPGATAKTLFLPPIGPVPNGA